VSGWSFLMPGRAKRSPEDSSKPLRAMLDEWTIGDDAIDSVHDGARASFAEVKSLTEYEDGKASRLLTIVAFLSAVVAAVFTRFASEYAWPGFANFTLTIDWLFPAATYLAFLLYITLVTLSVLLILEAIRPRFNRPSSWTNGDISKLPKSMLFYELIHSATPEQWGQAFKTLTADQTPKRLKEYYAKCYIYESHLIAGKVADKLRLIAPGVKCLRLAMWVLLFFFLLFGATFAIVTPTHARVANGQTAEHHSEAS